MAGGHQASSLTCRGRPRDLSCSHRLGTSTWVPGAAGQKRELWASAGGRLWAGSQLGPGRQRGCGSCLDPTSITPCIAAGGRLASSLSQAKSPHFTGSFPPVWGPPGLWRGGTTFPLGLRFRVQRKGGSSLSPSGTSVAFTVVVSWALLSFSDLRFEFLTALTFVVLIIR